MSVHYTDDHLTIHAGDVREVLPTLPAESVHCVVTSPPYWGLRDYGTATWEGGDAGCDHLGPPRMSDKTGLSHPELKPREQILAEPSRLVPQPYRDTCGKCGARRIDSQLGLEPTPEEYVADLVAIFREVRRVLRADGTVWLNLGDSYAGGDLLGRNDVGTTGGLGREGGNKAGSGNPGPQGRMKRNTGLKPKDLVGIPWRVAFALQADGWYLRSDVIWSKLNPMPESVTDRPTKAHEYVFLLTKSARYWYDADAVREPHARIWDESNGDSLAGGDRLTQAGRNDGGRVALPLPNPAGRNLRSVWTIATQPYPGAHFATFPEKLVEPCVKAGTSERGVCPECGTPWTRVVERVVPVDPGKRTNKLAGHEHELSARQRSMAHRSLGGRYQKQLDENPPQTTGWRPSCAHDSEPVPATVLDPFAGSGTTARVANRLGRRAVLIELNPDYIDQALTRNAQAPLGLGA